jgi:5-methylcytosine-specific restriction endonuclease McrA
MVKIRDGHQCQHCGTSRDLTVHLDPNLAGNHFAATIDDCITVCRACHGTIDAPRARA